MTKNKKEAPVYEEIFYIVPRHIRKTPGMTLAFLDVYETIFQFWNKGCECFLSNPTISERTGYEIRQVQYALTFLEKNKLLERQFIEGRRYLVQPINRIETDAIGVHQSAPPHAPECTPHMHQSAPINKERLKKENKELKTLVDSGECDAISLTSSQKTSKPFSYKKDEHFMQFYNAYPRKEKPGDAWNAFKALKPSEQLLSMILADIKNRCEKHTPWQDKKYVPLPAKYLTSLTWEGEIYNEEEQVREKKKKAEQEAADRLKAQEAYSKARAEKERIDHLNKHNDGLLKREIDRAVITERTSPPEELINLTRRLRGIKS